MSCKITWIDSNLTKAL